MVSKWIHVVSEWILPDDTPFSSASISLHEAQRQFSTKQQRYGRTGRQVEALSAGILIAYVQEDGLVSIVPLLLCQHRR